MKLKLIKLKSEILEENPDGYLIDANEKVARAIIESLKGRKFSGKIALVGGGGAFNRRAIESLRIDYLVSAERVQGKDSLKQRDSGINHVVAKEMAKRGIVLVVDFDSLASLSGKLKALRLARVMQNVKICRRAKCGLKIWGGVDEKALRSFGFGLGMSSVEVAGAVGD